MQALRNKYTVQMSDSWWGWCIGIVYRSGIGML
jgi:hypothetical protein